MKTCELIERLSTTDPEADAEAALSAILSKDLLDCPFCGSSDVHPQDTAKLRQFGYGSCIGCQTCGATMLTMHGYDASRQRWNKRQSNATKEGSNESETM